ncbi:hypothetical protein P691DRAFT_810066, partial [Macrolepiota fuliginosa MF-IS2]
MKLNAGSSVWVIGEWAVKAKTPGPGGEVEEERVGSPNGALFRPPVLALEGEET